MSQRPRRRLELAPALPYLDAHAATLARWGGEQLGGPPVALADILGCSRRHAQRFVSEGQIPELHADTLASWLGCHPINLWPEWADDTEGATL